ncbi:MAG: hypothetical protein ACYC1Q_10285 [Bacteroidia bacterium]
MKYNKIPDFDQIRSLKQLESNNESEIIDGLLSIVFYSADYKLGFEKSVVFSSNANGNVRACAIECFGHLARIFNHLDLDFAVPILNMALKDEDDFVQGKAELAIDDICHFLKINKSTFQ